MSRTKVREAAFRCIYQLAYGQDVTTEENGLWDIAFDEQKLEGEDKEFFAELVKGVSDNLKKVDEIIFSKLKNWTIERTFKIDLAILRVAVYEIVIAGTPYKVATNEAVELAKKYGNDDSANFVNGVLREVIKEKVE